MVGSRHCTSLMGMLALLYVFHSFSWWLRVWLRILFPYEDNWKVGLGLVFFIKKSLVQQNSSEFCPKCFLGKPHDQSSVLGTHRELTLENCPLTMGAPWHVRTHAQKHIHAAHTCTHARTHSLVCYELKPLLAQMLLEGYKVDANRNKVDSVFKEIFKPRQS